MAAPLRLRLFVGGTALVVAASAGWLVLRSAHVEAPTVEFVDVRTDRAELLTRRLAEGAEVAVDDLEALGRELYRGLIGAVDEDLARKYYAVLKQGRAEYVPGVLYRALPGLDFERSFQEHPAGGFRRRTNSVGMHEDQDPRDPAPDLRILVMGDSHVAGVCSNRESFPTRLEAGLAAADPRRSVEVLNLAQGSYDALNYLGTFRTWGELEPDVLVLVIYGGNDFRGSLGLGRYMLRRGPPVRSPYQTFLLQQDRPFGPGLLGQAVGQAAFFLANPDEIDLARD
ncbi:MAG: SGNH/GDSL hydrolase family protein, partial [Planctomycetota bacterium]